MIRASIPTMKKTLLIVKILLSITIFSSAEVARVNTKRKLAKEQAQQELSIAAAAALTRQRMLEDPDYQPTARELALMAEQRRIEEARRAEELRLRLEALERQREQERTFKTR